MAKNKNKVKSKYKAKDLIKTLSKSIREFKLPSLLAPFFVALEVVLECIIPIFIGNLIDELNAMQNFQGELTDPLNSILFYCGILLPLAVCSLVFGLLSGRFAASASTGFSKNLRNDIYKSVQDFSFENIDKYETSGLLTRITLDVYYVQNAYMNIIRTAIRAPLMIIFSIIMAFIKAPELAWTFLILLPVVAAGLLLIVFKAHPIFEKVFDQYDALNDSVEENIKGIRVVKSYVRSEHEKEKLKTRALAVQNNFIKADKIFVFQNPLMQGAIWLLVTLCTFFGGTMILDGINQNLADPMTIGDLNSLLVYGIQCLFSLMMFGMVVITITMAITSAKRICEVLNEKSTIVNCENPIYEVKDGDIVFDNVSFKYSSSAEKFALENVNLHIKSGESIGIIGGTGSSKSTLVNLISRLYDVTEGSIKIGGTDVRNYDLVTLRDKVSVVLQKNILFSGTIKDNLKWGNKKASDEEIINACKIACADEFVENFKDKYDYKIEQGGTNVSGGQKQRLCIARALLKNPKILILDDSTSAVDTKTDAKIRKGLKKYLPEVTKLIIAQRISSVQFCDRIIVMENGKIDAIGTHEELLESNTIYKECYISQTKNRGGIDNGN